MPRDAWATRLKPTLDTPKRDLDGCTGPVIHKSARHATVCSTIAPVDVLTKKAALWLPTGKLHGDKVPSLRSVLARGSFHSAERASNCQFRRHGLASTVETLNAAVLQDALTKETRGCRRR